MEISMKPGKCDIGLGRRALADGEIQVTPNLGSHGRTYTKFASQICWTGAVLQKQRWAGMRRSSAAYTTLCMCLVHEYELWAMSKRTRS